LGCHSRLVGCVGETLTMSIFERTQTSLILKCSCGSVEMKAFDAAITSAVCYCDTCQRGSRELAALPNASSVQDLDGGTAYVLYRADRVAYSKGGELLRSLKFDETATSRIYASCCNSAMVMEFDDARHWVCIYRARFQSDAPALEFRICTKFTLETAEIPNDVPGYAMYPLGLLVKLLEAKIAMIFSPRYASSEGLAKR